MSYGAFLVVLLSILIISLIWVLMVKKEQQVFVKRNIKYMLYAALLFLVLGSGGGLLRKLLKFFPDIYLIFLQIGFLGLGILHRYKLDTYFNWKEDKLIPLRLSFSLFIATLVAIIFFVAQWIMEWRVYKVAGKLADNYTTSMLVGLVPVFFDWAHRVWNQIPIVSKSFEPFKLPLDRDPPIFEQSTQFLRLVIQIPYRFNSEEGIPLIVKAPLMETLGNILHQVIDEHNVRNRAARPIEVAEERQRAKLYGWLFYKLEKRWWGTVTHKAYLPYDQIIKQTGLADRDTIYVERVKTW